MHGLKSTAVLLVILAGLVGYIYFVDRDAEPDAADVKAKAFDVSAEDIEEVQIRTVTGENMRVQRIDTSWQLVEPQQVPADAVQVASVTSSLAGLEVQRIVDENPTDLAQYGLNPPRLEVAFRASGQTEFRRLLIGETTPTGDDLYAKTPDQNRVFLISSFLDATFNKTAFDFRDKSVLDYDSASVTSMELARGGETLQFTRAGTDWRIARPIAGRADYAAVEGIMTRLSSAQMMKIVAESADDLRPYGLDRPAASVTLSGGSAQARLLIGTTGTDGLYAKDAARPVIFTVEESLAAELRKALSDFRRKDVFDARSFTADRLELRRGDQTMAFEKSTADGKEIWKNAAGVNVDPTVFEDMLTRLSSLQALTFETVPHASLKTPVLVVTVRFDGDKTETVTFGREGTDAYATRPDEPGAMKFSALPVDDILKALDSLK
jgi:hypothetical protein